MNYPNRLIEVDLPIVWISALARRRKVTEIFSEQENAI